MASIYSDLDKQPRTYHRAELPKWARVSIGGKTAIHLGGGQFAFPDPVTMFLDFPVPQEDLVIDAEQHIELIPAGDIYGKGNNLIRRVVRIYFNEDKTFDPWAPPEDPDLLPSSYRWAEAVERRATETMRVAYGGRVGGVTIPVGSRYFEDASGRILIGWHGTYDPPQGMDGEPVVR